MPARDVAGRARSARWRSVPPPLNRPRVMRIADLVRVVWHRPIYQRLFFAFTLGVFLSCAMSVAEQETVRPSAATPISTSPSSGGAHA